MLVVELATVFSKGNYLNIEGVSLSQACPHLLDGSICMAVENVEMTDPIFREEFLRHRTVESGGHVGSRVELNFFTTHFHKSPSDVIINGREFSSVRRTYHQN